MDAVDDLLLSMYRAAAEDDWREYRPRGLLRLCEHLGAASAAWWTRGAGGSGNERGQLTQIPQPHVDTAALAALTFETETETAVLELAIGRSLSLAIRYPHRDGTLLSTLLLSFAVGRKPPSAERLQRLVFHLVEADALSLRQFIRRDDWLQTMGRTSRGSAALVDADGAVHAASESFIALIGGDGAKAVSQLPFELPEDVLGDEGGAFVEGSLHLRVSRVGPLYLVYARRPLPLDSLSPREQEIARALCNGKTLKSISRQYGIAVSTVANHTTRIYRKLAIYRREDLIELVRARPDPARKGAA